jgi:ATP synthase F1 gamma subunit
MNTRDISIQIEESEAFKLIAQGYEEIASLKLKRIRADVERNRTFLTEMAQVFNLVNRIAIQRGVIVKSKGQKILSLALTSNDRFYGNINNMLIRFYMVNTTKYPTDRVVIGKTGSQYLKSIHYFHPFQTLEIKADSPTPAELKAIVDATNQYYRVLVYYPQLKTVATQVPVIKDITETPSVSSSELMSKIDFIFEPELAKVISFFDQQIMTLLLEQTFLEAELARTASRLISMDDAQSNANDSIKDFEKKLLNLKRSTRNINLFEILNSFLSFKRIK